MIFIGADHRGFELKEVIKKYLSELEYEVEDMGALEYNKDDDYPDFAKAVAEKVAENTESRGVLICGSGIGMAIAANKIKGIRAGTATSAKQIRDSVSDEDTNILAISADYISTEEVKEIVKSFIETKFSGEERHVRRITKIKMME
jgi:ribose 5-phosphate isomerase B